MIPIPNQGAFTQADITAILANIQGNQWTGNTYYLDPVNGLDNNNGLYPASIQGQAGNGPVKTLAAGYALLVSGNNDTLVLVGNGAASGTARLDAAFTWSKSACRFIGMCSPTRQSQRARIAPTATTTAFKLFFTISGTGNLFQNLQWFHGFNTGTTAMIAMTITGGRNVFKNCSIDGMGDAASATDAGSRSIKFGAGGSENVFQDCNIGIDTVSRTGANSSLEFSGGCTRNIFENCLFPFWGGAGGAPLGILASAAAASDRFQLFNQCMFINAVKSTGTAMTALATLAASIGGMLVFKNCSLIGITAWYTDATTKAQMYVDGPAFAGGTGLSLNPT
jgi:hypothetical protein